MLKNKKKPGCWEFRVSIYTFHTDPERSEAEASRLGYAGMKRADG